MLDGICPDAVDLLKDTSCPLVVFELIRQMAPIRQVEAAELMIGPEQLLDDVRQSAIGGNSRKPTCRSAEDGNRADASAVTSEQMARMERELASLQSQVKSVEDSYGIDNLHLTVAKGYVAKLLANARIVRWLTQSRPEYLAEFQAIAEIESIGTAKAAAE